MKRWLRWTISVLIVLGLGWAGGTVYGVHLTDTGALRVQGMSSDHLRIVRAEPTWFGKAVLFEDVDRGTFGVAQLRRVLLVFWQNGGGSYGYALEPGQPFTATNYGSTNVRRTQQFVVGVKVQPPIKYITIGSEDPGNAQQTQGPTLAHVQSRPKVYQTVPMVNGYALFVTDALTAATYTFHAFDTDGKLVADQLYAHPVRWVR
ncbi:MAG: hypothetical protein JWN15_4043 [Firmicutes bacterium]|nr:hypothetical protein [Bacillota bacterium]